MYINYTNIIIIYSNFHAMSMYCSWAGDNMHLFRFWFWYEQKKRFKFIHKRFVFEKVWFDIEFKLWSHCIIVQAVCSFLSDDFFMCEFIVWWYWTNTIRRWTISWFEHENMGKVWFKLKNNVKCTFECMFWTLAGCSLLSFFVFEYETSTILTIEF